MSFTRSFRVLATCAFLASASVMAGCHEGADDGSQSADVTDGVHTPKPGTPERARVVAGLHAVLDPAFHGQAIELVIGKNMRVHGNWAYVSGTIQGKSGKKIDWKNTVYAPAIAAGVFDGSSFSAVLNLVGGTWQVPKDSDGEPMYAVGATDVRETWWVDQLVPQGLPLDVFPSVFTDAHETDALHTPAIGTAERTAIVDGLHALMDPSFNGQETELVFTTFAVHDGWAYVSGQVQGKNGSAIDWTKTDYAEAVAEGFWDGPSTLAVLRKRADGSWYVPNIKDGPDEEPTFALGSTDFPGEYWADKLEESGAPRDIFPW